jgi:hypothetical protein
MKCEKLVSKFAFKWVNVCRYVLGHRYVVGLCRLNQVDP